MSLFVCSAADRHKNKNNDYCKTEVILKIRMKFKFGLRKK